MKKVIPIATIAATFLCGMFSSWTGRTLQGADELRPTAGAGRSTADAVQPNELRILEPTRLPKTFRIHPTAQAEPLQHGPALSGNSGPQVVPGLRPVPNSAAGGDDVDVSWKPIGQLTANTTIPAGQMPLDAGAAKFGSSGVVFAPATERRDWPASSSYWEAPGSSHGPLYFEEINLERYGYSYGHLQPLVSAAHFFGTIPLLPYAMAVHPPHETVYSLGYYRPGDPAPRQRHRIELQAEAGAVETAAVIGAILLFN